MSAANAAKTHCPAGHAYDAENTYMTATGRACRECRRTKNRERKRDFRRRAIEKLGGACVECGITDFRVLEIDHVNGGGGRDFKTRGYHMIHRAIVAGEQGFQVLCANHHAIKSYWSDR